MHYSKKKSWCETECKNSYAIGETEYVVKLEAFVLGGQRIDQKRKKGWCFFSPIPLIVTNSLSPSGLQDKVLYKL